MDIKTKQFPFATFLDSDSYPDIEIILKDINNEKSEDYRLYDELTEKGFFLGYEDGGLDELWLIQGRILRIGNDNVHKPIRKCTRNGHKP